MLGDRVAWSTIVTSNLDRVYDRALRMLNSISAANEITQATFVQAWERRSQYKGEHPISNWIMSICRRLCLDELRRRQRRLSDISMDDSPAAESAGAIRIEGGPSAKDLDMRLDLERALDKLDEMEREAFILVCVQGYTSDQAAAYVGTKPSTMRSRLSRAKKKLIELMDEYRSGRW
jgi:RNA polymerase sigma-70 factor (ECF subfamily)